MTVAEGHASQYYEFGPFRLAPVEHRLYRDGEIVLLPPKEFDLLLLLVRNSGQVLDRERLIKSLWPNTVVEEANLNVHISALRKALAENHGEHQYIETLPRLGYRFIAPVTEVNESGKGIVPNPQTLIESQNFNQQNRPAAQDRSDWFSRHRTAAVTLPLWLLAIAFLGILAVLFFKSSRPATIVSVGESPLNIVPLTTYPGRELQPSFSPDGNQIAFVWSGERGDNSDIYVRLVDGGNWVRVTNHPGNDVNPVWSPDGRAIAFYRSAAEEDGIYIVPSLGGAERKLTDTWANRFSFGSHTWVHWSPVGNWLVISDKASAGEPFSLYLISQETGERRRLTLPPSSAIGDCSPAFSPDGKMVAFVRVVSAVVGEVYLVSVDGGEPKRLTFAGAGASNLTWALNGREIVFASRYGGTSRLLRIPAEGGTPQWLAASGSFALYPTFTPHGNRLAWVQNVDNSDIYRVALKSNTEEQFSSVIASTTGEISPRYSPDGKRIVFVSNRSGSDEIWVCSSKGENAVRLTSFRGPLAGSPNWSPDGRQISFDCRPEGNADIFVISSDGGQPRRLTTDPAEDIVPSFSRDGRSVYFTSNRSGGLQLWKMNSNGDEQVQLTKQGGFEPVESPDGHWVYYTQDRGSSSIWRVKAGGGEETPFFDFQQKDYSRMWAINSQGIYFASAESQMRTAIKFFNYLNKNERTVREIEGNLPTGGVSGLALSPDGKWLLFPFISQRGSDLMMIENFH
jgi:Tol biopolymer transport system component/DNA-binding winged helix-turn-helix (wHTH) protein